MNYCGKCGNVINDDAQLCVNCSSLASQPQQEAYKNILAIIGFVAAFFLPLAGLICAILGLVKSKTLGNGKVLAIWAIVISVVMLAYHAYAFITIFTQLGELNTYL